MSPRLVRILVISYAVKTLLLGLAWILVPDLPERALGLARSTFSASETP